MSVVEVLTALRNKDEEYLDQLPEVDDGDVLLMDAMEEFFDEYQETPEHEDVLNYFVTSPAVCTGPFTTFLYAGDFEALGACAYLLEHFRLEVEAGNC